MKKRLVSILTVFTIFCINLINSDFVHAGNLDEPMNLIKFQEIQVVEDLINRAESGIDDFKARTGKTFEVHVDENFINNDERHTRYNYKNIETYQTSQYLGTFTGENGEEELYALKGIVVYNSPFGSDTQSTGVCTITTTVYCSWGTGSTIELKFINSTANLSANIMPSTLKMENCVNLGWDNPQNFYNTTQYRLPSNGVYSLASPYNGYISQYGSYVGAEDTVMFGDGGSIKTSVYVQPK